MQQANQKSSMGAVSNLQKTCRFGWCLRRVAKRSVPTTIPDAVSRISQVPREPHRLCQDWRDKSPNGIADLHRRNIEQTQAQNGSETT